MDATRTLDSRQIEILQQLSYRQSDPPSDFFLDDILEFAARGLIAMSRQVNGFVLSPKGERLLAELN